MMLASENSFLVRPACFRGQPDSLTFYAKDPDPNSLRIDSREQLFYRPNPNFSKARPDTANKASPPFPTQSLECANISQCLELLNCAGPERVIEHIYLDLSYNDVWELDRLQVAQELARRAPDLKMFQLKCFLPLQGERKVPAAIAEFALVLTKLHPLLNSLTGQPSDDDLHVYYTFVTDDYKLGPNVPIDLIPPEFPTTNCSLQEKPNLRKCDVFSPHRKRSGVTKKPGRTANDSDTQEACASLPIQDSQPGTAWGADTSLESILHLDLLILGKSRKLGLSQAWIDHGGKYLLRAGPLKPRDADITAAGRARSITKRKHKTVTGAKASSTKANLSHQPTTEISKARQCVRIKRLTKHNLMANRVPAIMQLCQANWIDIKRSKEQESLGTLSPGTDPRDSDCWTSQARSTTISGPFKRYSYPTQMFGMR
jgi:hypothetical protein